MIKHVLQYLLLLLVALAARLPHILSDHFVLDGDEAIVGMMLNSLVSGNGVEAFFWGQNYGLVLPELMVSYPFAVLFDVNDYTLKLPQLIWFALGSYFIFLTIARKVSIQWAWGLALFLVICSTWYLWGMRVRGGYGFSFALAHAVMYFTLTKSSWKNWEWLLLGLGLGGVFTAQQLWFPAAFAFSLAAALSNIRSPRSAGFLISGLACGALPWLVHYKSEVFYQPAMLSFDPEVIAFNAQVYWSFLVRGFNGLYLHGSAYTELTSINLYAVLMTLSFFAVMLWLVKRLFDAPGHFYYWAALLSLGSIGFGAFFLGSAAPRYALPLIGYMLVAVGLLIGFSRTTEWMRRLVGAVLVLFISLSVYASTQMSEMYYEDMKRSDFKFLFDSLRSDDIKMVFTGNYMLQWQLMYYSDQELPARSVHTRERVPRLYEQAMNTYRKYPERSAIVDFTWDVSEDMSYDAQNEVFSIIYSPSQVTLHALGYKGIE